MDFNLSVVISYTCSITVLGMDCVSNNFLFIHFLIL